MIRAIISHFPATQHIAQGEPRDVCIGVEKYIRRLYAEGKQYVVEVVGERDRPADAARVRGYIFDVNKELANDAKIKALFQEGRAQ